MKPIMARPVNIKPLEYYIENYRKYRIRMLALTIKHIIDDELGTATAMTLRRILRKKYGKDYTLEEIDEAIQLIVDSFKEDYQAYRRSGHLGIRKLPNPDPIPPQAKKLVEELLVP